MQLNKVVNTSKRLKTLIEECLFDTYKKEDCIIPEETYRIGYIFEAVFQQHGRFSDSDRNSHLCPLLDFLETLTKKEYKTISFDVFG